MIHHNPRKTRKPGPNPPEMTESGDGKQLKAHNQSCKQDRKGTIKDNHEPRTTQCVLPEEKRHDVHHEKQTWHSPHRVSCNDLVLASHHGSPEDAHVAGHCDRRS